MTFQTSFSGITRRCSGSLLTSSQRRIANQSSVAMLLLLPSKVKVGRVCFEWKFYHEERGTRRQTFTEDLELTHALPLAVLLCSVDILICTDDKVSHYGASDSATAT